MPFDVICQTARVARGGADVCTLWQLYAKERLNNVLSTVNCIYMMSLLMTPFVIRDMMSLMIPFDNNFVWKPEHAEGRNKAGLPRTTWRTVEEDRKEL